MSDIPREFVFTRYPGRQAMTWLRTAYVMFSKHRAPWILVFAGYMIILLLVSAVPVVGGLLVPIVNPLFAVGILAAAWNEERGAPPAMKHLLQGFHSNVWALIGVGTFLLLSFIVAAYLSFLLASGRLEELQAGSGPVTREELMALVSDRRIQLALVLSALIGIPLVIVSWWASALVVFQDAGAWAAIATAARAALANWKAVAVYSFALIVYGVVVPHLMIAIVALLVPPPAMQILLIVLVLPYLLIFIVTFHVSYYVSYRDVFHANETLAPLSRGG